MKRTVQNFFLGLLVSVYLLAPMPVMAADIIIKYYIFSMESPADETKVVEYIKQHDGVTKVETVLDRHWVYVHFEDEILNDERYQLRLNLGRELGYPVERWEIQWEHTEGHD
ncbi:MAG: hypothetical protein ABFS19_04625 [Thermodesulfobacteriota bacterium]